MCVTVFGFSQPWSVWSSWWSSGTWRTCNIHVVNMVTAWLPGLDSTDQTHHSSVTWTTIQNFHVDAKWKREFRSSMTFVVETDTIVSLQTSDEGQILQWPRPQSYMLMLCPCLYTPSTLFSVIPSRVDKYAFHLLVLIVFHPPAPTLHSYHNETG
jgi:hypothetical protein